MKKIPLPSCGLRTAAAVALVLGLSACAGMTEPEKRTAIGAGVGGVAGALIGNSQERSGYCVYRDRYGRTYEARCR